MATQKWTLARRREYQKLYAKKHKAEIKKKAAIYRKKNKAKLKATFARWYEKNKKEYNAKRAQRLIELKAADAKA